MCAYFYLVYDIIARMRSKRQTTQITKQKLQKEIEKFEKTNPEIAKAMKLFELSMYSYEQSIKSMEPIKTITSSSTKVLV